MDGFLLFEQHRAIFWLLHHIKECLSRDSSWATIFLSWHLWNHFVRRFTICGNVWTKGSFWQSAFVHKFIDKLLLLLAVLCFSSSSGDSIYVKLFCVGSNGCLVLLPFELNQWVLGLYCFV